MIYSYINFSIIFFITSVLFSFNFLFAEKQCPVSHSYPFLSEVELTSAYSHQCAIALCGEASSVDVVKEAHLKKKAANDKKYFEMEKTALSEDSYVTKIKELAKALKQFFVTLREKNLKRLEHLKFIARQGEISDKTDYSDSLTALYHLLIMMSTPEDPTNLSPEEQEWFQKANNFFANSHYYREIFASFLRLRSAIKIDFSLTPKEYFRYRYSSISEEKEAVRNFFFDIEESFSICKSSPINPYLEDILDIGNSNEFIKNMIEVYKESETKNLSEEKMLRLILIAEIYRMIRPFCEGKTEDFIIKDPYPKHEFPYQYFMKKITEEEIKKIESHFYPPGFSDVEFEFIYQYGELYYAYLISLDYQGQKTQLKPIRKSLEEIISQLSLSEQSKSTLINLLSQTFIRRNKNIEEFHKHFMEQLLFEIELNKSYSLNEEAPEFLHRFFLSNAHSFEDLFSDPKSFYTKGLNERFDVLEGFNSGLGDFAFSIMKSIKLSWYSEQFPAYGKGIIGHELGHVLDSGMTSLSSEDERAQIKKIKHCLSQKHPHHREVAHDMYDEEDFADLIGALSTRFQGTNFACALLRQSEDQYINLSLVNLNPTETHSAPLFRALHIHQIQHGTIPSVCQKLIDVTGDIGPGFHETCLELPRESTCAIPAFWKEKI